MSKDSDLALVHNYGINISTREIYLHSYCGSEEEPGIDYRSAVTFVKNLHFLDRLSTVNILIHMQIEGGDWAQGMAIFDAIRACRSSTTILAYAQASSMSGLVLQAAKKRVLMPNCEFLMHYGSIALESHFIAAKSAVLWDIKLHNKMLGIFAERAVKSGCFTNLMEAEKFFDEKMKENVDWYLTGEEVLKHGLCDGIFGTKGYKTLVSIRR